MQTDKSRRATFFCFAVIKQFSQKEIMPSQEGSYRVYENASKQQTFLIGYMKVKNKNNNGPQISVCR